MRWWPWFLWGVLVAVIILAVAACAVGTTNTDPVPTREGGANFSLCLMFSICNFQGTTGQVKTDDGSVQQQQKSDAKQEGTLEVKPKP